MKKSLNIKKLLIMVVILALIIVSAILIIRYLNKEQGEIPEIPEEPPVVQLPDTTYSEMQVTNIVMEYREQQNQTVLTFSINNTTAKKVANQHFTAILIGAGDDILAKLDTYIQDLDVGQQHRLSVIYEGDVTATKQIKLVEK